MVCKRTARPSREAICGGGSNRAATVRERVALSFRAATVRERVALSFRAATVRERVALSLKGLLNSIGPRSLTVAALMKESRRAGACLRQIPVLQT